MIRVVFFDIDGTLLDGNRIPDSAKDAIARLQSTGILVCLATGRSEAEARAVKEELGIRWAVTCNGAHIGRDQETIIAHAFPVATASGIIQLAKEQGHSLHLYAAYGSYITRFSDAFRLIQRRIGLTEPLLYSTEMPFYQMIVFCEQADEPTYRERFPDLIFHRWDEQAVDLNPPGVNKGQGVSELLRFLNISPEEAVAFGDGDNDFSMFEQIGASVAMGNAVPGLKRCATYTTKSVGEHGIEYALSEILHLLPKKA